MGLRRAREREKFIAGCRLDIQRLRARAYSWAYALRFQVARLASRFGRWITLSILILLLALTVYLLPRLHVPLTTYYDDPERLASLRSLLQALGGALLGAAAIVSSLVLFAMQVNVERMPYGLFRQLGSDRKLLSAFAVTFVLALGVAAFSAIPDRSWALLAIVGAIWATALILVFFLYAYRRALRLISPTMQVQFIVQDATKYLSMWARRAQRIAPLIQAQDEAPAQDDPRGAGHDTARVVFYGLNAHWTEEPRRSLQYLVSIGRRYAAKGDHDVAETALSGLVDINAAYVKAKGKTFFTTNFMIDHPLSTDGFVNATLEHLRQYAKVAIARRDEEQIEQAFRAFTALVRVYATIDYSDPYSTKTHAGLAAGYLSQEVEAVIPHDMPDVLMEGVRLMGQAAGIFRAVEAFEQIQSVTEKIRTVAAVGAVKESHRPATLQGVQELATLTLSLLRTKGQDLRFTLERIRKDIATIAELLLTLVPDTHMANAHSTYLAPYYSATSTYSLSARLTQLVNLLLNAEAENEDAQAIIHTIEQWAEELYATEKKLLLLAVARRSHFTFDMIAWIRNVTELLLATSQSPACDAHTKDELHGSDCDLLGDFDSTIDLDAKITNRALDLEWQIQST